MQLGLMDFSIGKSDQGDAFELAPAPAAVQRLQTLLLADREINRDDFNRGNLADQLKVVLYN